ncbi:GntR family transcriptional regulator [Caproiciproducens sp. NJN-50]|uniref:GntR family transcriptional regulator n=1 Tax=Acutalibacteraceae TaxID=3082771 RepID=UPI000FFE1A14|nr:MULTISPECIES: GntR family transcriptional regulator [Acutalibacteraceae]QAT48645.1 GntR family transcriptional regulator [Caproiciproducens sp. NJN-50]
MNENIKPRNVQPYTADEVYKKIRRSIIKLQLEPGQMISENQMSQKYNVSRSVIRSAFVRLQQIRFIEIYPQRGTYVSLIDLNHISDLLMLRTAVEKEVIYEMFTSLKKKDRAALVNALESNLAEQEKCRNEPDYNGKFPWIDSDFHKTMIDSVGRYSLVEMLADDMLHIARWRNFDVAFDHRIPALIDQHRAIVEAIKAENMLLAQKKMADHLETISNIADRAKAKFPSYFK